MNTAPEKPAFTFNMFGTTTQQRQFLQVFEGFEAEWESQGFKALDSKEAAQRLSGHPTYPLEWKKEGPTASAFYTHFLQLVEFLREPATTAAIEAALGGFLHAALHRCSKFFAHPEKGPTMQFPIPFCPSMWFEQSEILVTVFAEIQSPEEFKVAELLIPEGFRRAAQWVEHHGITHPYITYFIQDGRLDSRPTLSEHPPTKPE